MSKPTRNPAVTFPQSEERAPDGSKLPRSQRHKNLKAGYVMVGKSNKPWECKLRKTS